MSHYLIEQLAQIPNVRVRPKMEVVRVEGNDRVERLCLRTPERILNYGASRCRVHWQRALTATVGRDLAPAEDFARTWKETRDPLLLESSVPGVFAAGDVRAGAMNRVASAVGEGSMAIRLVFDYPAST